MKTCSPSVRHSAVTLAVAATLLGACSTGPIPRSGGYYQDDGPDETPRDVSQIPDAVPRHEPLASTGNKPYTVFGVNYVPLADARDYRERGIASWYGKKFHGRRTSSGEPYDMYAMTAAHRTLPLPSYVRVTNLQNGRSVIVRVNDRGPFLHNRLIDLSYAAASRLGVIGTGTAMVEVQVVSPGAPVASPERSAVSAIGNARTADRPPRLMLQVGAFAQRENALAIHDRLKAAGFTPIRVEPATTATHSVFRVRIGPIASVEQGDRLVADVARHGIPDAILVID
jgi:rare lipoprotein A